MWGLTCPLQIDVETALLYRRRLDSVPAHGTPGERKKFIRTWVREIKPTPERLEVEITYRVPELFFNNLVAGAWFGDNHNKLLALQIRRRRLP